MEWKKLTLEDKAQIEAYYRYEQSNSCEVSFANNILWSPFYEMEYGFIEGMLVFLTRRNAQVYDTAPTASTYAFPAMHYNTQLSKQYYSIAEPSCQ